MAYWPSTTSSHVVRLRANVPALFMMFSTDRTDV